MTVTGKKAKDMAKEKCFLLTNQEKIENLFVSADLLNVHAIMLEIYEKFTMAIGGMIFKMVSEQYIFQMVICMRAIGKEGRNMVTENFISNHVAKF